MNFNITGVNTASRTGSTSGSTPAADTGNVENLWDDEAITPEENVENNTQTNDLQAKLAELEAQRQALVAEKNELLQQKAAIASRKAAIEAQIKANEEAIKANNEIIVENQQKIEAQQKQIETLQQQYDEKCKEAEALNEKINERIAQILEKSEQDVQEATEKIRKATEEAYAKVESGELKEEEVAQYVSQKAGISNLSATTADFAEINSMNNQMRTLVASAKSISNQMVAASELITTFQANITAAINTNQEVANKNRPLNEQLNELNKEESFVNSEIKRVDAEIVQIDTQIAETRAQLNAQPAKDNPNKYNPQDKTSFGQDITDKKTISATTKVDSSNPFLAISYDNASFTSMADALDAMVKANEQTITNAQATVEANNEIIRNIFQEQMKK